MSKLTFNLCFKVELDHNTPWPSVISHLIYLSFEAVSRAHYFQFYLIPTGKLFTTMAVVLFGGETGDTGIIQSFHILPVLSNS